MFPHPRVGREGTNEGAPRPSSTPTPAEARRVARQEAGDEGVGERLSLMELVVAEVGGWASAILYRCHLPAGPFLVSDGVVHMDLAVFCADAAERTEPSTPE